MAISAWHVQEPVSALMDDNIKKITAFILPAAVLIFIDQLTKILTLKFLKGSDPVVLIRNVLELLYVENRGAAFGIFNGMKYAFVILAAIISIAAFICFIRLPDKKRLRPFRLCLVLITSGAVGNVIDRIRLGYVVDFIYFKPINFPVFNFADICVTCAAFLLIVLLLFVYKEEDLKDIPFIRDNEDKTKA